ncbi:Leukocyte-antigen-related-like [Carabus blaptoides fortunei]
MEPIRILKLMWTLITLVTTFAKGQDQHAGPPDIMMYYNYKQSQVTCIAGTNTYGNAVTFITPLQYPVNPVFQYKDRNGNNIEEMGCDYEQRNVDQQCIPKYTTKLSSGKHLTSPVTDERWNKFETQYTAGRNPEYSYMYPISETNFHISISVRTRSDAQILLYANKQKNDTFLRKCSGGIPDDYPRGNNNPCKIARDHKESNHMTPILTYTDDEPFDIDSLYIRGTNKMLAEWKIHDYRYLVISRMNQDIKLGTTFRFLGSDTLCISMYVAVCSRCAMEIMIQSDRGTEVRKRIYGKQGLFMPWQLQRIQVEVYYNFIYSLRILATAEEGVTDTFWAVDDIRRCYDDEIKVSSTQVAQQAINSISCQSLQYPEWTFTESRNINNSIECSDSRFTGTYCNISCKSILSSDYCENNMICRPTVLDLDAPTQCTCAPNSRGPQCKAECSYGYFGYNCQNECGKCQGGNHACDKISGKCSYGCEEGYKPPNCIFTIGPVLLVAPTLVSVSHTSVTLRLDNITTLGDRTADTFQIEYKLAGSDQTWQQNPQRVPLTENVEVTVSGFQRETTYSIRVVLYAFNGDTYRLENVPYTNATTTCEVNRMVNIEPFARHVNINLHNNEEGCSVTNYFVILTPGSKRQYFKQNWEQIDNLKPFTTYTIIIGNSLYPEYNYTNTFTTLEDAPSAVRNLKALRASDTTITVTWDVPFEENGNIIKYMVSTRLQNYIGCVWNADSDDIVQYIVVTPDKISDVLISNLHPYARYKVSVIAVTVANGTEISEIFGTLSSNGVSDLELPSNVTVDSYSKQVNLKWIRPTCANILGPLRYNILITCIHDPWCDQVTPVTREFDAFNNYVSVDTLTPFTNYTLELRASRNGTVSEQSITVYFATKEGAPPAVRSLKDYSRDGDFISLRWLAPYPPHGTLEYYIVEYCYYYRYSCAYGQKQRVYPLSCSLWDEDGYMCYDITNTESTYKYEVSVRAKNVEFIGNGADNTIDTKTIQSSSSAPLNLNATWNQYMLILHWDCPDLPGGPLKHFLITLRQFDTEILANKGQNKEYNYKLEVDNQPLRRNYNYTINQTIPYSTSYNITVCGVNKYKGAKAKADVNTPPETPVLGADIAINSEAITNTTISITIPGVQANTTSSVSYVYVIVSEQKAKNIVKRDADLQESSKKEEILQFAPDAEDTWIAGELPSMDSNSTFIVGSNSQGHSEHLNEDLINKPLKPARAYDITIVLMNVYRNKRSYKDYKAPSRVNTAATPIPYNPSSAGLYALLLLLFVPVLLYFLYRRTMSKNPGSNSRPIINIPGWNIPRTEIQNEPDVIPLTESSGDPLPEKRTERKKPAIMPKPGQSSQIPDESTKEAKVSNTATMFFHSQLVLLNSLENYVKEALANKELDKQHALFPRGQTRPWDYGIQKQNKFKNRYNNLIAYDDNRVKLKKINSDQFSDYINASYIHGYKQDKAYIATQGPKPTTVNDFWRMIWQEKVQYIVMLANVIEGGKKKCEKYWPDIDTSQKYGEVEVLFIKSDLYADFEYRLFNIKKNEQTREILQMHFTSWPDHGVPIYPQSLVPFLKKLLTLNQSTAPIVVHCSAGVGRTGTIILCDICLRMAAREGAVDALRYLHEMREQRANMVDNSDQYKLVHMVLLECLLSPDSNIPCNKDLSTAIQRLVEEGGLQIQLNYLQQSSWKDQALNFASKKNIDPANTSKNRFNDIVPVENRIYISRYPTHDEHSDYINAVPVDGFRFKDQFIVTQTPLPNTVIDFWRMVAEKEVKVIVSLNGIPVDDQTCCIYWPSEQEEITSVPNVCIRYHKYQTYDHYDVHTLVIEKKIDEGKVKSLIQVVQFNGWNHEEKLPPSKEQLVTLWEESDKLSRGNYPMVVTCYNGATASGLFVAMSFVIEKVKLEQHCDPCLAVRVIRRNRKQFITDKAQLEFLYKSAVVYLTDTNALSSALVFNTKLNVNSESIYVPTNNQYQNIFNCNFAHLKDCHESYSNSNNVRKRKSGTHFIAPVLDERWEKFPLLYSDRIKIQHNQALSIKMNNRMKLYLAIGSKYIEEIDNPITGNETKWKHFVIRLSKVNKEITIFGSEQKTYQVNVNNFTDASIRSNTKFQWKHHIYNYLELYEPRDFVQIGPEFAALRTQTLCISMHVAVCGSCEFQLQLMNDTNHIMSNVVRVQGIIRNNMVHWNTIRLTASVALGSYYKIIATNIHVYPIPLDIPQPSFWTIDDIRECDVNEIRISKLYTADPNVSCEALKFPDWNVKQNNLIRTEEEFNCNDDRYIGRNCNISCQLVLDSQRCDRNILCQPTRESQTSECRCVGGYFGPNCNEDCATGHVEYKCEVMYDHINTPAMSINYKCDENAKICTTDNNATILNPNYQMYLPLLALLALPVIAFLIYWFVLKKLFEPHYVEANAPRVGTYIEVINENGTYGTESIPSIQMTDQRNEFSIYENIKNITEVSVVEPIYGNISTEDTNATDQRIFEQEINLYRYTYVKLNQINISMDLKALLKLKISHKKEQNAKVNEEQQRKELEDIEDKYFEKYYHELKNRNKDSNCSYKQIPKFFFKLPKEDDLLQQKFREEARSIFLQRRSRALLDNNELKALWLLLDQHHSPPFSPDEQFINYADFLKVAELAGPKCKPYFTATVFAKLQQGDPHGRVSIMSLFNYAMRKVWFHQTRIGLSLYDVTGQGYLRETDLENYILELIPTLPQLEGLEKSFHSFYVCTAVRKFLFFLDPLRTGRVRIQDILACSFLDDLLELRDEDLPKDLQEQNWFSAPSALRVYGQYLNLDRDHNGMLSKEELSGYGTGTLTGVFLDRVFQECLTYDGEMDYKTYLDFVLALENRQEPQSLHFLFKILDINSQGYLDAFTLNYFFRAIQEQMSSHGAEIVHFEDVKDEIFDMVKPADPARITLSDLLSCGQGDTMISILIEFHGFWAYENREAMSADSGTNEAVHV